MYCVHDINLKMFFKLNFQLKAHYSIINMLNGWEIKCLKRLYYIEVKYHCIKKFKIHVSFDINDLVYNFRLFTLFCFFFAFVENNIQKQERLDDMFSKFIDNTGKIQESKKNGIDIYSRSCSSLKTVRKKIAH